MGTSIKAQSSEIKKLTVVTTTTMITDLVRTVGGSAIEVLPLMHAGVDPHQYKPSARDVSKIRKADAIIYNGLHLEGKMGTLFEGLKAQNRNIYALGEAISPKNLIYINAHLPDPHIWFDCDLWKQCTQGIVSFLSTIDPANAAIYHANGAAYTLILDELHAECMSLIQTIPQNQRVLITSHDAFNYFGTAYGMEVLGVQGISTVTEAGIGDIVHIIDFIKSRGIKAIFVETSVSQATIQRISKDANVQIGGELFSDSTGSAQESVLDTTGVAHPLDTYVGMLLYNVHLIVKGLQ
jgi:manganese/zinc/iron transport system substrate-binding protein